MNLHTSSINSTTSKMKQFLKNIIPSPMLRQLRRIKQTFRKEQNQFSGKTIEDTFTEIYKNNYWKSPTSISGPGSDLTQTRTIREELPHLINTYKIKSILDIPCGDFFWMKEVNLDAIIYTGMDIVKDIVEMNSKNYNRANISFLVSNLIQDPLPQTDLIICRDCLVHFSYKDIQLALTNISRSGSKFLLTTSFVNKNGNEDIITGDWRSINLEKHPFNFPKPIQIINEQCTENNGENRDKSLCLWDIDKIKTLI